ncbi:hypothetical protein BVH03_17905 [Pseudomonas sp. PA15(2017)]|uniref:hypothetical protein n=1 Tax=Pseudomonas sp. PA15(2017) TaxID=1932111 RepID=UPI00095A2693|nr:hypothetical protein [Pseudomonas sp. PA15(2017)]OLU25523.1 hypothetical protein BVH03_17905 [Pseudomonas sp. PA15(2017)]
MNPLFKHLSADTLSALENQLTIIDDTSDEELFDFLLEELDLSAEQAEAAIALRPQYMGRLFLNGNSPLYQDTPVYVDPAAGFIFHGQLTEYQILTIYRMLLASRHGTRLKLNAHECAGLNNDGQLYWTPYNSLQPGTVYEVYGFEHRQFEDGHWQGETLAQTTAAIQHPEFID